MNDITFQVKNKYPPEQSTGKYRVAVAPNHLPVNRLVEPKDVDKKYNEMNFDIYKKTKKEEKKNGFSFGMYFKFLCGVILATTIGTNFSKIRDFFRRL